MRSAATLKEPRTISGLILVVFSAWLFLEGALMKSVPQVTIAVPLAAIGLRLRHRGIRSGDISALGRRWLHFVVVAIPVLLLAYVIGYFALMDRHRPTSPAGANVRFDSSLRWAPREWIDIAIPPHETPWGSVTTWNILYRPMDRLWFRFFPRSSEEIERLRALGYYL